MVSAFFYMFHVEYGKRGKLNAERSGILWLAFFDPIE
jgi:hypothetical protein